MQDGQMGVLYRIADWLARLIYANLLWIMSALLGLVVFGLFPATVGLYTVVRQWIQKRTDIQTWKVFWSAYRKHFIKANVIGFVFLIIGWILQIDLRFFQTQGDGILFLFLAYFSIFLFIVYMIVGLFLFPTFVHFELKPFQYFKQTFFIVVLRPMEGLMAAAGFIIVYYVMTTMPVLIIFFGMSSLAVATMWPANRAFEKLQLNIKK